MSSIQIPNLPAAIALSGTEQLEAVQAGVSRRITVGQVVNFAYNPLSGGFTLLLAVWFAGLPTTLPATEGQPWNNGNMLSFS